jgi:putative tryptophan/tyrosine transport system substrate-binding protein
MKRPGLAFLIFILSILVAPLGSEAQPAGKVYRIGYLSLGSPSDGVSRPLRDTLRQLGYVEGQNLLIESRFADAKVDQLPGLAADLVRRNVDLIVTIGTPPVQAAKEATGTIPIVMAGSADPVEHGFVASLAQPGGNVTGVTHSPGPEISGKGIELLKEAVPTVSRVAVLWDSSVIHEGPSLENQKIVARKLGVTLLPFDAKTLDELNAALVAIPRERANGLFIFPNFINGKHARLILDFAATNRLPTMFQETWSVENGGLMSYYTNWDRLRERAAIFVDRILKGAKPGDLPVEQPTKFDLVISLKTAKALGLTIPPSVLARADEVLR